MAEYINKAELMEQYPEFDGLTFADVTTIDIVTCGECTHHQEDGYCTVINAHTFDDAFCSCGKR